ncbi:MAG: hypothetical protein HY869_02175 [Chloroflexi bacterium]|nr:hypothetical protein [Chloroflexota bacterium]
MDPTLTGVLIGAIAGILGGYLSGWQQARLERQKWQRSRQDDTAKEISLAVAELMKKMAATAQNISWFTWEADYRPDRITKEAVDNYDVEMRRLFPEIDSALIVVSALSSKAYERLSPFVKKIYDLDLEVSRDTRMIINAPGKAIKGIASHKDVAFQLKNEIMKSVANINNETAKV